MTWISQFPSSPSSVRNTANDQCTIALRSRCTSPWCAGAIPWAVIERSAGGVLPPVRSTALALVEEADRPL